MSKIRSAAAPMDFWHVLSGNQVSSLVDGGDNGLAVLID